MDINDFQRKTEKRVVELERIVDLRKSLACSNVECGKVFQKVLMLTDLSKSSKETYYACPHCLTKVEILVKEEAPAECPYYFGFLKNLPKKTSVPDECLACPKIMECKKGKTR